jgi:hypothetical protein
MGTINLLHLIKQLIIKQLKTVCNIGVINQ